MADDTYVEVGPMSVAKNAKKVPKEHAKTAKKLMQTAAEKEFKKAKGFTPKKNGKPAQGFYFDATLNSIVIDEKKKSVTCAVSGVVATWPRKKMLTSSLSSKPTLKGGTSKRDIEDCISIAVESAVKQQVVPFLKRQK